MAVNSELAIADTEPAKLSLQATTKAKTQSLGVAWQSSFQSIQTNEEDCHTSPQTGVAMTRGYTAEQT